MRFWSAAFTVLLVLTTAAVRAAPNALRIVLASPLVEEGSGPDGCTPAVSGFGGPAVWEVRVERFLLDGKALVETSREPTVDRFPLCIASLPVAKNAEIELSFVTHVGGAARVAGIVLRFTDPQDFYVVEADALAGRVRLVRVLNGERREIAERPTMLAAGKAQSPSTANLYSRPVTAVSLCRAASVFGAEPIASRASATYSLRFWTKRICAPNRYNGGRRNAHARYDGNRHAAAQASRRQEREPALCRTLSALPDDRLCAPPCARAPAALCLRVFGWRVGKG